MKTVTGRASGETLKEHRRSKFINLLL